MHSPGVPFRKLPMVGIVLALVSCTATALDPGEDTVFVLRSIDGESLPASVSDGGLAWIVEADTIRLEAGSRWRRHSVQRREAAVGGDPLDVEEEGFLTRQDGLLLLEWVCNDTGGDCIAPDRVVESPDRLEMEQTYKHAGRNLVFERM